MTHPSRTPLIAGNWKMHGLRDRSVTLAKSVLDRLPADGRAEVVVAPVFTVLESVARVLAGTRVGLSAQDVYWAREGAFTGEVSAEMLRDAGCAYVIVGHSERRQYFGETDESVARKTAAALGAGLTPIVCVGETLAERDAGQAEAVVTRQLDGGLGAMDAEHLARVVLAYEPVWAIGTGRTAKPADAQAMHAAIRAWLIGKGRALGDVVRILYGGSVKADNAASLLAEPDIDGALVGGASLDPEAFASIIRASG